MSVKLDIEDLVGMFYDSPSTLGEFAAVDEGELPQEYRRLLAHNNHMTVTLESFHESGVSVEVLESRWTPPIYQRKILLHRDRDGNCVQFGLVRLDTTTLSEVVRSEILAANQPLGRILIDHDVMRNVYLRQLYRVQMGWELAKYFGRNPGDIVYGRTAQIDLGGHPALQLVEIVAVG